jgi:hypothetical protein
MLQTEGRLLLCPATDQLHDRTGGFRFDHGSIRGPANRRCCTSLVCTMRTGRANIICWVIQCIHCLLRDVWHCKRNIQDLCFNLIICLTISRCKKTSNCRWLIATFQRKNGKRSSVMRSTDLTSWANGIYFVHSFPAANSNWSAWYERRLPNLNYFWRTNQPATCILIRPRK